MPDTPPLPYAFAVAAERSYDLVARLTPICDDSYTNLEVITACCELVLDILRRAPPEARELLISTFIDTLKEEPY